jgi:hypothetical protein
VILETVAPIARFVADAANDQALQSPITYLTGLGFPGIIIVLFITGKLRWGGEVDFLRDELKKRDDIIKLKDEQITILQDGVKKDVIPALTRSVDLLEKLPETERQVLERYAEVMTNLDQSLRSPKLRKEAE